MANPLPLRALVLTACIIASSNNGFGQDIVPGNRINLVVHARCVTEQPNAISYVYSVNNLSSSSQLAHIFEAIIRIPRDSIFSLTPVDGWLSPKITVRPNSQGDYEVMWFSTVDSGGIPPGQTTVGFKYSTRYLPGIGLYYAEGYHPLPTFPEGMAEDSIPGYTDLTPYGPGIIGPTVVPVISPNQATPNSLFDSLLSYTIQCRPLGWITTPEAANRYQGFINRADESVYETVDPHKAVKIIDSLLNSIPQDSSSGMLTTDACALFRSNGLCLKSKLMPSADVRVGLGMSTSSSLRVNAKPKSSFSSSDSLVAGLITIRWKSGSGYRLGSILATSYDFSKDGDSVQLGGFTYQRFRTNQRHSLSWDASGEYTLFEIGVSDPVGIGQFELTNSLPGGESFVDINYLDKTDSVFYQPTAQGFAFQNKSSTNGATTYNGQRLTALHGTKFHEVFQSASEIIYRRKDLNSANWDTTLRISAGNGVNTVPSIAVAHDGSVHVVWERQLTPSAFALWYNRSTDGGLTWGTAHRLPGADSVLIVQQNQWEIYPQLAELGSSQLVAVVCSSSGPRYMTSTDLGSTWSNLTTITGVRYPTYVWHPSLAPGTNFLLLTYDTRYYGVYSQRYGGTSWLTTEQNVSSGVGTVNDRYTSIAVDGLDVPQVAWCAQRSGQGEYRIIYKSGVSGGTGWNSYYTEFSHQTGISDFYPSLSAQTRGGSTWRIDVQYMNTANQMWLNQTTYGSWGGPLQVSSSGQWATTTLQERGSSLYNDVRLWTDQSGSSPYEIKRVSDGGYQLQSIAASPVAAELHRRVTIESSSNGSFISFEVGPIKLVTGSGDTTIVPFKGIDKSKPLLVSTDNAWDYLGTDSVALPSNARYLVMSTDIQAVVREDSLGTKGKNVFAGQAFRVDLEGGKGTVSAYSDPRGLSGTKVINIAPWAGQKAVIRPAGTTTVQAAQPVVVGVGDIYVKK